MRKKGTARSGRQENGLIYDPLSLPKQWALQFLYFNAKPSISVDYYSQKATRQLPDGWHVNITALID
jgi:hypothetical protein